MAVRTDAHQSPRWLARQEADTQSGSVAPAAPELAGRPSVTVPSEDIVMLPPPNVTRLAEAAGLAGDGRGPGAGAPDESRNPPGGVGEAHRSSFARVQ